MNEEFDLGDRLPGLVDRLVASYHSDSRTQRINRLFIPSREEIAEIIELLLQLMYPGFFGRHDLTTHNVSYHVGGLLPRLGSKLYRQVVNCLSHAEELAGGRIDSLESQEVCHRDAADLVMRFLDCLPQVRDLLAGDVQAAYDGDPAATNTDEVILAYPGLLAVTVYRLAHELHVLGVPLMPRIMTEWAHTMSGTDIHPGARIGRNFFIDHASGVVVGETSEIGDNVKLYQGVTLGALSFRKDERGRVIRGYKRHPTVKDRVTIYANATVLGGETVLGERSVVGGSVFLTESVPDEHSVSLKPPELRVRTREPKKPKAEPTPEMPGS
jgi:serine O-acetyltransferase